MFDFDAETVAMASTLAGAIFSGGIFMWKN